MEELYYSFNNSIIQLVNECVVFEPFAVKSVLLESSLIFISFRFFFNYNSRVGYIRFRKWLPSIFVKSEFSALHANDLERKWFLFESIEFHVNNYRHEPTHQPSNQLQHSYVVVISEICRKYNTLMPHNIRSRRHLSDDHWDSTDERNILYIRHDGVMRRLTTH